MLTRSTLAQDLRELGLTAGDTVMVHASLRAIGDVAGGPDQVHLAIKDVLGETGTMLMYASCPRYYDEVGRGNLTAEEEAEVLEALPPFDAATARAARDNGALVELFRTYPGSRVNDHVARFVVWGAGPDHLLAPQPWDLAFGRGSLLERFVERNGRILLLGSDLDAVTFLHYAEHIVDVPDKRIVHFQVPVLEDGRRVWKPMSEVDTATSPHARWPEDHFAQIVSRFLADTGDPGGLVGNAQSYLVSAPALLAHALRVLESWAAGHGRA